MKNIFNNQIYRCIHSNSNHITNTILTALAPIFWGTTYIVTTELLPVDRPLFAAVIRVLPVGILLTILSWQLPNSKNNGKYFFAKIILLSFLNISCFQAMLFIAAYRLPGGIAAVIGSIQPIIIILLMLFIDNKRPNFISILAIVFSILGMGLLFITKNTHWDLMGILAAFIGALSMAVGMYLTKYWQPKVNNLTLTGWQLMFGGFMLVPLVPLFETIPSHFTVSNLIGYAYLAIFGSLVAYSLWFRGIQKLNTVSVSLLGALSPITATLIGWFYLNQTLSGVKLIGFIVLIISVIAVQAFNTTPNKSVSFRNLNKGNNTNIKNNK